MGRKPRRQAVNESPGPPEQPQAASADAPVAVPAAQQQEQQPQQQLQQEHLAVEEGQMQMQQQALPAPGAPHLAEQVSQMPTDQQQQAPVPSGVVVAPEPSLPSHTQLQTPSSSSSMPTAVSQLHDTSNRYGALANNSQFPDEGRPIPGSSTSTGLPGDAGVSLTITREMIEEDAAARKQHAALVADGDVVMVDAAPSASKQGKGKGKGKRPISPGTEDAQPAHPQLRILARWAEDYGNESGHGAKRVPVVPYKCGEVYKDLVPPEFRGVFRDQLELCRLAILRRKDRIKQHTLISQKIGELQKTLDSLKEDQRQHYKQVTYAMDEADQRAEEVNAACKELIPAADMEKYQLDPKKLLPNQSHLLVEPDLAFGYTPTSTGMTPQLSHLSLVDGRSFSQVAAAPARRPPPPPANAGPTPREAASQTANANRARSGPRRLASETAEVPIRPAPQRGGKKKANPKPTT